MGLKDAYTVIIVDDEPGKAVALAMDEPVTGG
jgi:hypothetical protein